MILEIYILFCVVFIPLFWLWQPMDTRSFVIILGTTLTMVLLLWRSYLIGDPIILPIPSIAMASFLIWIFLSNSWSTCARQSWIDTLVWLSLFFLFCIGQRVDKEYIVIAVSLPVYGMLPIFFFQKFRQKQYKPGSIFGNPNHMGSYLTLNLFVFLWLSFNTSVWFLMMAGIIVISIYMTKHKTSIISSALVGSLLAYHYIDNIYLLFIAPLLLVLYLIRSHRVSNLKGSIEIRIGYYIACLDTVIHRPITGWGLRTFRREQFFAVHRIGKKYPDVFKKYPLPTTHRLHNDYLEIFHELGIVGFLLFLYILYGLNWSGDIILSSGLLAVLVISFFFFPLREPHIAAPFWVLAGTTSNTSVELAFPPGYSLMLLVVVLAISCMAYWYAYNKMLAIYWWMQIPIAKTEGAWRKAVGACHKADPYYNQFLMYMYKTFVQKNPDLGLDCISRLSEHFDGSITAASVQSIRPKFNAPVMQKIDPNKKKSKKKNRRGK